MISERNKAWLQLCRFPNVFTAVADPLAGALMVGAVWRDAFSVVAVACASACLYLFGMILNDWYDFRRDLKERPDRPLPSRRIRKWQALLVAIILMLAGVGLAYLAGPSVSAVAVLLVTSIVTYDVLLKEVPIAPGIMGLCRSLNLLMGMALVPHEQWTLPGEMRFWVVFAMGVYVCGITVFARRETRMSQGRWLRVGALLSWVAVLSLGGLPSLFPMQSLLPAGYVWSGLLLVVIGYKMALALLTPRPETIQPAVKAAILGIILFDAALVGFTRGFPASVPLVLLLVPAIWLGKWLYST